jgi:putative SOS response-associated peptidase YedK
MEAATLACVYRPFPSEEMRAWAVSPRVNTPKKNHETLLEPIPIEREPGCDDE